jgi:hypothetical protein
MNASRHLRGMPRRWCQRRWRRENHHGIPPNNCRQAVQQLGATYGSWGPIHRLRVLTAPSNIACRTTLS